MNAKGILLVALAAAAIAAAYQSQSPKPKHLKLGKRQCLWIPTTPADTARNAKKSLKCTLSSSMSMVLDSAGVGSGGGKLTVTQDSAEFTVDPGPPAVIAFDQQPTDTLAGQTITPAVTVFVGDGVGGGRGNPIPGVSVTLSIASGPGTRSAAGSGPGVNRTPKAASTASHATVLEDLFMVSSGAPAISPCWHGSSVRAPRDMHVPDRACPVE